MGRWPHKANVLGAPGFGAGTTMERRVWVSGGGWNSRVWKRIIRDESYRTNAGNTWERGGRTAKGGAMTLPWVGIKNLRPRLYCTHLPVRRF